MRTLISALGAAVLGLLPIHAQFLINPYRLGTGSPPPSYTGQDSVTGTTSGSNQVGNSAINVGAAAVEFTPSSSYTVTRVDVYVAKNGSPTMDCQVEIWTQSTSLPGVIVGTPSAVVNSSTFPAAEGAVSFYPSAAVTSGTPYYVVLRCNSLSATDYILWYRITTSGRIDVYNPAGMGTWSNSSVNRRSKFQTFSS